MKLDPKPQSILNSKEKSPEIWRRMYNYFKNNKENFLQHYHRRSNVESTFAMIKMGWRG